MKRLAKALSMAVIAILIGLGAVYAAPWYEHGANDPPIGAILDFGAGVGTIKFAGVKGAGASASTISFTSATDDVTVEVMGDIYFTSLDRNAEWRAGSSANSVKNSFVITLGN